MVPPARIELAAPGLGKAKKKRCKQALY